MRLIVVRHGQTEWNANNKVLGRPNIPLNKTGLDQALVLADDLSNTHIDIIFSSPLERAYQTATIIAQKTKNTVYKEYSLIEQDFGIFEGVSRNDEQYQNEKHMYFSRYPQGESFLDVAGRVYPFIKKLILNYPNKTILLVTHNGIARIINTYFKQMDNETFASFELKNGHALSYDIIPRYNEYVDILDETGNETNHTELLNTVHKTGMWHASIHMWIYNTATQKILLQKRSMSKESYPGYYDVAAAGHINHNESPENCAVRETQEELGIYINPQKVRYIDKAKLIISNPQIDFISNEFNYVFLYCDKLDDKLFDIEHSEIESVEWLSISEIDELYKKDFIMVCTPLDEWLKIKNSINQ